MAELADAHGSGPCSRNENGSSSLLACTIKNEMFFRASRFLLLSGARRLELEKAWSVKKTVADSF